MRITILPVAALVLCAPACRQSGERERAPAAGEGATAGDRAAQIARGERLVTLGGCNDCHTPLVMGPNGPERDTTHFLAGHPQELALPPAPELSPGPWIATMAGTMTAWSGPWGTTFTANLTPDRETGLGNWTAQDFIATMRTGRHLGKGRRILPPMPMEVLVKYTDEELGAVFAYLQSLKPVKNRVPAPIEPKTAAAPAPAAGSAVTKKR